MRRVARAALYSLLALAASSCVRSESDANPATERPTDAATSSIPTAKTVAGTPRETPTRKQGMASTKIAADRDRSMASTKIAADRDRSPAVSQAERLAGDTSVPPAALPSNPASGSPMTLAKSSGEVRDNNEGADSAAPDTPAGSPPANDVVFEDETIYSSADDEVQPPALLTRGFLGPLVSGVAVRTSLIELAVSKSGSVEKVQLLSRSQNMRDALLLSRAKQFQFRPASKNGIPVDYRVVIVVEEAAP
jgi:hypothetical protein